MSHLDALWLGRRYPIFGRTLIPYRYRTGRVLWAGYRCWGPEYDSCCVTTDGCTSARGAWKALSDRMTRDLGGMRPDWLHIGG